MVKTRSKQIVEYCARRIIAEPKRPLFVAITGDSGSGKSFYSEEIRECLKNEGIHFSNIDFDDFLIPRKDRLPLKEKMYTEGPYTGKTHWELLENWFYLDKFKKAIVDLKEGRDAHYFPYSRSTGDVEKIEKVVVLYDIVILDSSMFSELMDFVILIEVDQDTIIQRKLKRDSDLRSPEEIIDMHKRVQGYFWKRNKPKSADIIIDNNDISHPHIIKE